VLCTRPIYIPSAHEVYDTKVPCGQCYSCISRRRNIWTFRLVNELKDSESGYFVTLTYDDEHVPKTKKWDRFNLMTLDKTDVQKFTKRLRGKIMENEDPDGRWVKKAEISGNYSPKYRYFACGEYGNELQRPHYHILMYNLPHDYVEYDPLHGKKYSDYLEEIWGKGRVDIGKIELASCHYVAKYSLKELLEDGKDPSDPREEQFAIMSRNPGIGINYANEHIKNYFNRTKHSYATIENNQRQALGRYYKEKIFDEKLAEEVSRYAREYAIQEERDLRVRISNNGGDFDEYKRNVERRAIKKAKRNLKKNKL